MKLLLTYLCFVFLFIRIHALSAENLYVLTVATEDSHGLQRYERSAKVYGISYEVLGMGEEWKGGNMAYPGGGHKVNLLKKKVDELMQGENKDMVVMFTDSYDVIFLGGAEQIVRKFEASGRRVLFSAEPFCWPEPALAKTYPDTTVPNPYLNSGGFIGYLEDVWKLLQARSIADAEDDQLYYTKLYLDEELRGALDIGLDHTCQIFQNLNGALSDVKLHTNTTAGEDAYLENESTGARPLVLHGNGPAKLALGRLANYLARAREPARCVLCDERRRALPAGDRLPRVMLAVFVEQPTPFLEEFLQSLLDYDYPKKKLELVLRNNVEYHEEQVQAWFEQHAAQYAAAKRVRPDDLMSEADARRLALERCANSLCDYLLTVDSVARLTPGALRRLLASGFDALAPLLARPDQPWTNFWGALSADGYYARAPDYMDIVNGELRGIWNVPFITNCYLLNMELFRKPAYKGVTYSKEGVDADMAFCESLRNLGIMMHVSNEEDMGYLVDPESFDPKRTHPDVYQLLHNRRDWERRYISPDYWRNFDDGKQHSMPCPDVYWFPLVTERFCAEWIDIMEAYGKWSDGSNKDSRLEGGYEAVPTRDIHMKQVGLDAHWLHILRRYVRPLQEMVFLGYFHDPPVSLMNFVVRYRPDEQPSLRPHHDSSTYTINLALNTPQVDYTGGGCRFLRYNCSVVDTRRGWLLMHPGRLTHYHEGLPVLSGTRYIMISFVDP
ncbi:procollagen-lysine,2-oxoglutarate 5-dioxygenase isoform X2 [Colias croceus]|uniref:procollagen-lysine,2-oxoglutarate 5-dioxygenase isoform X2 n=1 Tax=Colias crocea TaxID=72248 RepID=UPI001E27CBC2|nr:procollagen-lysine,2-oxoglutarate 5-dioxygenase isoform X2 [Colias croceus]